MENGVKLYNDRNYPAAVAEFQAAYTARPGPNPLLNVALCEKAQFHYPKAIAALETALARHGDVMDPADRKAAEDAIREMRALLGAVVVQVTPPDATLLVDGEELPAGAAGAPLQLGPGQHRIEARARGFAPAEQSVTVASGQSHEVTLALVADKPVELPPPPPPTLPKEEPPRRGIYLLLTGSLLFPAEHIPSFNPAHFDYGAGYGGRIGFQVNNVAGFDISYQHSSITTYRVADTTGSISYRLLSDRVTLGLRLITPGKLFRFVGTFGLGFAVDGVTFGSEAYMACTASPCPYTTTSMTGSKTPVNIPFGGVDAYGLIELGAELDIDHVLIDLGAEGQFEATANLTPKGSTDTNTIPASIYGSRPIINVGPAVRIGYRFW
jgi:hypothetical protein